MHDPRPRPVPRDDARVITLGRGPEPAGVTSNLGHPTEPAVVELVLDGPDSVVLLSEGSGHLGSGGAFRLDEMLDGAHALQQRWAATFARAGAVWAVPLLARLAAGDAVDEHAVALARRGRTGTDLTRDG